MKIDALVAEIGSTTTVVNGFNNLNSPCPTFIGQGQAPTTVIQGDVNLGLRNAIDSLKTNLKIDELIYEEFFATSSAAGGLKMTVHGLVYDMTVRAAKEAALGAGANIHLITAGRLRRTDIQKIKDIKPNIILLAGGVDYGERDTAIYNGEQLAALNLDVPIIYAGNVENREEIEEIFKNSKSKVYQSPNIYPKIDELNIEPAREIIQRVFEEHITHAPGMEKVRDLVKGNIMPTPGAVMLATKLLKDDIGDVMTIDVGGATTDVHSVTEGSDEINRILISPEPTAKRTVEGDLGVYININNIIDLMGKENVCKELGCDKEKLEKILIQHQPIPVTKEDIQLVELLTEKAVVTAVKRHCGRIRNLYGTGGKRSVAQGKDLTCVKYIVGTGGALTRLPHRIAIMKEIAKSNKGLELLPQDNAKILVDHHYIMASLGVLSQKYDEAALYLLKSSLHDKRILR